jgi:ABC-type polysaccharide/polyol phosphate export permease
MTLISLIPVFALAGSDMSYIRAFHAERPPLHLAVEACIALATIASGIGAMVIAIIIACFGARDGLPLILSALALYLILILMLGVPPFELLLKPSGLRYADRKRILGIGVAIIITAPAYWVISSSDRWFLGRLLVFRW